MVQKRQIEIFSAGCAVCTDAVKMVEDLACDSCEVTVLRMQDATIAARAAQMGIKSVPAILIDGKLADCCAGGGPDEASLQSAGIGQPLP